MTRRIVPVVCVAAFRGDDVLLLRHVKGSCAGLLTLPGGKCDAGEEYTTAAVREFREETGIEIPKPVFSAGPGLHFPGYVFWWFPVELPADAKPVNREPHKHSEMGFFPAHLLPDVVHEPDARMIRWLLLNRKIRGGSFCGTT